jgi:hypothetical protein
MRLPVLAVLAATLLLVPAAFAQGCQNQGCAAQWIGKQKCYKSLDSPGEYCSTRGRCPFTCTEGFCNPTQHKPGEECPTPDSTRFVPRPEQGTILSTIILPNEPATLEEITHTFADQFAAGVLRNNGSRRITSMRVGWAVVSKTGEYSEHTGALIDLGSPLAEGIVDALPNQNVTEISEDFVKLVFFVAEVNFADGGSYTADAARVKTIALTDK